MSYCLCAEITFYDAMFDGAKFSDGKTCNGVITDSYGRIYFHVSTRNGDILRADEMPFPVIRSEVYREPEKKTLNEKAAAAKTSATSAATEGKSGDQLALF